MHYIKEVKDEFILALHGQPVWSYSYKKFILYLKDHRFIATDLIGFGKSDIIVGSENYTYELHLNSLKNFIDKLKLNDITRIVQDWGSLLGLRTSRPISRTPKKSRYSQSVSAHRQTYKVWL